MFNRFILAFALCIQSCFALADSNDDWAAQRLLREKASREAFAQKVYGMTQSQAATAVNAAYDSSSNKVTQKFNQTGSSADGGRINASATVTKTPNKAKVAEVLANRLKTASDYAKRVGKASVPTFVGMAAFHGLMEGIDYVMGEGGEVQKKPDLTGIDPNYTYTYEGKLYQSPMEVCKSAHPSASRIFSASRVNMQQVYCGYIMNGGGLDAYHYVTIKSRTPEQTPQPTPVTEQELKTALTTALASNSADLKQHIDNAIKAAYSPDRSEGQNIADPSTNSLALDAANDAKEAIKKAGFSDGTDPNSSGKPGYYKITDGDKTVEGYVYPVPSTGTTDTTTTPALDPVTGQPTGATSSSGSFEFPAFCDWASIVCEWIDWTKQEPEQEEQEQPEPPSDQGIFDWKFNTDFNLGGQCPGDLSFTWTGKYFAGTHTISLQWLCLIFTFLGYPLVFLSHCIGVWIFYEVASRKELKSGY